MTTSGWSEKTYKDYSTGYSMGRKAPKGREDAPSQAEPMEE